MCFFEKTIAKNHNIWYYVLIKLHIMIGGNFMKKKIIAVLVCCLLVLSQMSALAFNDVKGHWAEETIKKMSDLKIINGYDKNTFGPEDPVRRVDSLLLVSRILGASDVSQSAYVDAAYAKYFGNVNVLGYAAYEKTLAYLLYRNTYTASDLKDFIANTAGDKALKRYEAAIILVKVMGAEDEVKANTMPMLEFDDSSQIPANAKSYVEYCATNGLMKGMDNNKFSPNTNVTRAQMATMLNTVMNKLDFTYSAGTVSAVNTLTDTVTYIDGAGSEKTINLVGEITPKLDGKDLANASALENGMKINVVYSRNSLYAIEFASVVTDSVYQGIYVGNTIASTGNKIKFKENITDNSIIEIPVADNCAITFNGKAVSLNEIAKEASVKITVNDGKAISVEVAESTRTVTGVITEFTYDTPSLISIKATDGTVTAYELGSNVSVNKNHTDSSVSELTIGDKVTLTIKYNKVSAINSTSSVKNITGKITKIVISSEDSKITISNNSGSIECSVNSTKTDYIKINGESCNIYDLKLGYEAKVELESSSVKSINITAIDTAVGESSSIAGKVLAVDTNFNFITISTTDGSTKQIFVSDDTYIVDSSTTKVKKLSSIKAGDTITATVSTTDNTTLVAITIVIM